jgi:hypothetical protein
VRVANFYTGAEFDAFRKGGFCASGTPGRGAAAYLDIAKRRLRPAFALGSREVRLEEGRVSVFRSLAFHEVSPSAASTPGITVTTNRWFS